MNQRSDVLILNVDDTEAIRYAKTRALKAAGYAVVEAGTGAEALELARSEAPTLALLDVRLPDMSGIEVCEILKRDHPSILVLQISATFVSSADKAKGLERGADSYLTQPVGSEELTAAVGALLRMRRAEDELRHLNEVLETRVVERTEALRVEVEERKRVEAALGQAQKMEAIGHLTGGLAHDFNNLLMAVLGNLEMLQRRLDQGRTDVKPLAAHAMEAAERAAALTQRLLAFARRQPLESRRVDLATLFAGLEGMIRTTVGAGIEVEVDLAADVPAVLCDPHQLENAVLNLSINARDAMPNGGRLQLAARQVQLDEATAAIMPNRRPGDYVRISVSDSGVGMSPETAAQAFDPFFTTKPPGQGTGLGLAMTYSFARQSQGAVELTSELGKGTEVALLLPCAGAQDIDAEPALQDDATYGGHGQTILIVEDEPLVRKLVSETLGEFGYRRLEAADATEALALEADGAAFDLVLTDVGLPGGVDGRELAVLLRKRRPSVKIVLTSGHAASATGADDALADAYLPKPYEMRKLAAIMGQLLRGDR